MYTYTHNALPGRTSRKETGKVKSDSFPTIDMETNLEDQRVKQKG